MVKSISETQDIINKAILDNDFDKAQQIIDKAISSDQLISRYFKTAAMFLEKINPNNKTEVYLNNPFNYIIFPVSNPFIYSWLGNNLIG